VYEMNIEFEIEASIQALKAKIAREDNGKTLLLLPEDDRHRTCVS
jgi:hypothetical protein